MLNSPDVGVWTPHHWPMVLRSSTRLMLWGKKWNDRKDVIDLGPPKFRSSVNPCGFDFDPLSNIWLTVCKRLAQLRPIIHKIEHPFWLGMAKEFKSVIISFSFFLGQLPIANVSGLSISNHKLAHQVAKSSILLLLVGFTLLTLKSDIMFWHTEKNADKLYHIIVL